MSLERITEKVFQEAVNEAVREVIEDHVGSAIDDDFKREIRARAKEILATQEMTDLIRRGLAYWILGGVQAGGIGPAITFEEFQEFFGGRETAHVD